jgi:hypothetical protein
MKNLEVINKPAAEINENPEEDTQENNLTLWTVTVMLIIWIYVIMMSLF